MLRLCNSFTAQIDMVNVTVRNEIDSHRKKLVLYDKVYERLNKELAKEKRAKKQLIETSNDSYMQHEDAKRQCERLELINEKEQYECDRWIRRRSYTFHPPKLYRAQSELAAIAKQQAEMDEIRADQKAAFADVRWP